MTKFYNFTLKIETSWAKEIVKSYLHYKTTSQNMPSKAQIKNFVFCRKIMSGSQDIQILFF